jgi:hypothetical protein
MYPSAGLDVETSIFGTNWMEAGCTPAPVWMWRRESLVPIGWRLGVPQRRSGCGNEYLWYQLDGGWVYPSASLDVETSIFGTNWIDTGCTPAPVWMWRRESLVPIGWRLGVPQRRSGCGDEYLWYQLDGGWVYPSASVDVETSIFGTNWIETGCTPAPVWMWRRESLVPIG